MNKLLLSSLSCVLLNFAFAQPTIQSTSFYPTIGESFTLNYGNYIAPGSAGNNVTWDLSSLNSSTTVTVNALAPNASFPGTEMSLTYTGQSSLFVDFTPTQYNINGMHVISSNTTISYSDPMQYLEFPMTMGDSFVDNFEATFSSSGFAFTRTGTISVNVDGYGTLITPQETHTNVLRVHSVQQYTDDFSMGSIDVTIDNYIWVKAGFHHELAMVQTMSSDQGSGSSAYYTTTTNTMGLDETTFSSLKMYPNPSNDKITISNATMDLIEIHDVNGRVVYNGIPSSTTETVDISALDNGIYYVSIHANNSTKIQKIIKY